MLCKDAKYYAIKTGSAGFCFFPKPEPLSFLRFGITGANTKPFRFLFGTRLGTVFYLIILESVFTVV